MVCQVWRNSRAGSPSSFLFIFLFFSSSPSVSLFFLSLFCLTFFLFFSFLSLSLFLSCSLFFSLSCVCFFLSLSPYLFLGLSLSFSRFLSLCLFISLCGCSLANLSYCIPCRRNRRSGRACTRRTCSGSEAEERNKKRAHWPSYCVAHARRSRARWLLGNAYWRHRLAKFFAHASWPNLELKQLHCLNMLHNIVQS